MQKHLWVIMIKWAGCYWGLLSLKTWATRKEANEHLKKWTSREDVDKKYFKVVKMMPTIELIDTKPANKAKTAQLDI